MNNVIKIIAMAFLTFYGLFVISVMFLPITLTITNYFPWTEIIFNTGAYIHIGIWTAITLTLFLGGILSYWKQILVPLSIILLVSLYFIIWDYILVEIFGIYDGGLKGFIAFFGTLIIFSICEYFFEMIDKMIGKIKKIMSE